MSDLINNIRTELGDKAVLTNEQISEKHLADWSGETADAKPDAVIRPANTNELSVV